MLTRRWLLKSALPLMLLSGNLARIAFAKETEFNSSAPDSPTLIFLLAGQSNMVGLAEVLLLPKVFQAFPPNVVIWDGGDWKPMNVQGTTFGPEVAFAHAVAIALPNERIGIVKYAKGGTAIREWAPTNQQSLYAELMKQYRAAHEATPSARPAAMLWMQGERDSRQADTAAAYGGNLQELVAAARKEGGDANLPFLCGLVNPPVQQGYTYVDTVRAAQIALPKQTRRAALVSTNGLQKNADNLHYGAQGQLELGLRFAQAYLSLTKSSVAAPGNNVSIQATSDPFDRGEIWSGKRFFDPPNPNRLMPEPLWLIVTERDGMKFKGEGIVLRGAGLDDIYKVEGTATTSNDGPVSFTTEKKGFFQVSFDGRLIKDEVVLSYKGSGLGGGAQVSGTANLLTFR